MVDPVLVLAPDEESRTAVLAVLAERGITNVTVVVRPKGSFDIGAQGEALHTLLEQSYARPRPGHAAVTLLSLSAGFSGADDLLGDLAKLLPRPRPAPVSDLARERAAADKRTRRAERRRKERK